MVAPKLVPNRTSGGPRLAAEPNRPLVSQPDPTPTLVLVKGQECRRLVIDKSPFLIGRHQDNDLVINDAGISRQQAALEGDTTGFFVVDRGSKHGTFVNGERVQRRKLQANDRITFKESGGGPYLVFQAREASATRPDLLTRISIAAHDTPASELEKVNVFIEAMRKLSTADVLQEVLITVIASALRLTGAQRGYVFLRGADGALHLAAGRDDAGNALTEDSTISHSTLNEAATGGAEFLVSNTLNRPDLAGRYSIVAHDLQSVICIPLRQLKFQEGAGAEAAKAIRGVLYLDSHVPSRDLTGVGHEILHALATEAATLVENAALVQAEETARRYRQELTIAGSIQQQLMTVTIPETGFATVHARCVPCSEIGGDFYDVVRSKQGLAVVLGDVSGKGVSAAVLASVLQGMIHTQLAAGLALAELAKAINDFLCEKQIEEKFATAIIARLDPDGALEYVNCGHLHPLLVSGSGVRRLEVSNIALGLVPVAAYQVARAELNRRDRVILLTDGITEAENSARELLTEEQLQAAASAGDPLEQMFCCVVQHRGDAPQGDDCTVVELTYRG